MKTIFFPIAALSIFIAGTGGAILAQESKSAVKTDQPAKVLASDNNSEGTDGPTQELVDKLAKYLTGAKLTGHFTFPAGRQGTQRRILLD